MNLDQHVAPDGESYLTGWRIQGQHCGRCGQPDSTRPEYRDGMLIGVNTLCCGFPPCGGHVVALAWRHRVTGAQGWACCLGEAERHMGKPVWIPPRTEDGVTA